MRALNTFEFNGCIRKGPASESLVPLEMNGKQVWADRACIQALARKNGGDLNKNAEEFTSLQNAILKGKGLAGQKRRAFAADSASRDSDALRRRQAELARQKDQGQSEIMRKLNRELANVKAAAEAYARQLAARDRRIKAGQYTNFEELMMYYSRLRYIKKTRTPVYKNVRALNYDNQSATSDIKIAEVTISDGIINNAKILNATLTGSRIDRAYVNKDYYLQNYGDLTLNGGDFTDLKFRDLVLRRLVMWDVIHKDTKFVKLIFNNVTFTNANIENLTMKNTQAGRVLNNREHQILYAVIQDCEKKVCKGPCTAQAFSDSLVKTELTKCKNDADIPKINAFLTGRKIEQKKV